MLTIRLSRVGKRNHPQYRIVLQQKTKSPKGESIAILGYYHPIEKQLEFDVAKAEQYIKNGAKPSSTVARLMTSKGMKGMELFIEKRAPRAKKGAEKAA